MPLSTLLWCNLPSTAATTTLLQQLLRPCCVCQGALQARACRAGAAGAGHIVCGCVLGVVAERPAVSVAAVTALTLQEAYTAHQTPDTSSYTMAFNRLS